MCCQRVASVLHGVLRSLATAASAPHVSGLQRRELLRLISRQLAGAILVAKRRGGSLSHARHGRPDARRQSHGRSCATETALAPA
jgi:hypothetical protein